MNTNRNDREFNAEAKMIHPGQGHRLRWLIAGGLLVATAGTKRATDATRTTLVINS